MPEYKGAVDLIRDKKFNRKHYIHDVEKMLLRDMASMPTIPADSGESMLQNVQPMPLRQYGAKSYIARAPHLHCKCTICQKTNISASH